MGAGPAAAVLGRGRGDAPRIPDPRPRFRGDGGARQGRRHPASYRRDGDRRGKGARSQDHARPVSVSLITGLDHVVVLVNDLDAGVGAYQALFARAPAWRSTADGAETALFTLENMTLELMSPAGEGAASDRVRAVLKEQGEGLASICFSTSNITRMLRRLDRMALKPEPVSEGGSRDTRSGAELRWQRTRTSTEATRGVRLFFLEMAGMRPRSAATADAPVIGLDHIGIATGDPERS